MKSAYSYQTWNLKIEVEEHWKCIWKKSGQISLNFMFILIKIRLI
jgi:hypothetical protein